MGEITIKTVHEVPPSRIFHRCSRGVELHPRRGSATRFSTAVQQANPRPGRRTEDGIVRETAQGVALTPAGKAFLVDARRILEDCDASIKKAQRISRGEIGELAVGYMSALTHDFLGKALEVWRQTSPGIVVDCIEMDTLSQERALMEGRIAVGIL